MKKGSFALALLLFLAPLAEAHEGASVEVLGKATSSWDGTSLAPYPGGQPEVTVLRITVPPKTSLALHRHPVINAAVLLEGEFTVITKTGGAAAQELPPKATVPTEGLEKYDEGVMIVSVGE